jgi:hypothetical protein
METIARLADAVLGAFRQRDLHLPRRTVIEHLFRVMYHASIAQEESEPIRFHVCYIDPARPDPDPPLRIVRDRWRYFRFSKFLPFSVSSIAKIAPASDPRSSALAVYPGAHGDLMIWGIIDQQNRYQDFLTHEEQSGPERPGIFEARIVGAGHIVVQIDYEKIAELRLDTLQRQTLDVLARGPLHRSLQPGITVLIHYVTTKCGSISQKFCKDQIEELWLETVQRLLLRIQRLAHGGALLLTPTTKLSGLNVHYRLNYQRLRTALQRSAATGLEAARLFEIIIDKKESNVPGLDWSLYFNERSTEIDTKESDSELDCAVWFVALLSRVDGLTLLTPELDVQGFGVEITVSPKPAAIEQALSVTGTRRKQVPYNHFGTRHRSMMRYCYAVPGSVGFVVSQDGEVRAMTRIDNALVFWENIRLQTEFKSLRIHRKKMENGRLTSRLRGTRKKKCASHLNRSAGG